ncbi:hypothetical protein RB614_40530 [Phytohabitans sp. ZYX-F-186]|uniref:Uncharacterized protein n=1 Tax=Phytohabitans maris TaxID=3071409 RepID=A0ABU0ZUY3_9ACTN|nr:hypothetical protein [Phytohabitans sp. ZYX-F-186]MDQ7910797.1 hypothetical protein [Phytohabitans sp. ZYX-F-186]
MTMTKATQETVVGEGLAAGCLKHGVTGITSSSIVLDGAFRRAWSAFPMAGHFPAVRTTLGRETIRLILAASARRRGHVAGWQQDRAWWAPYITQSDWTPDDVTEHLAELHGIPESAWSDLAKALIDDLGDRYVRRG